MHTRPGIKIRTINAVAANPRAALAIILALVAATVGLSVGLGITLGLEGSSHTTGWAKQYFEVGLSLWMFP